MSTIHEALKKAQKDRDARRREQDLTPFSARPSRAKAFRRAAWVMLLVLVVAVAAYALQSRFRAPVGDTRPAVLPRQGAAAPEARAQAGGTPSPAAAFYEKARALHKQGLFRDAGRWYDKALATDPGHVDALNNLGVLLMRGGEMDRARELLEKAARLAPRDVDPLYNLACLHALAGDTARGMAYLDRAAALDPAVRDWARGDEDLACLRGSEEFQRLVGRSK